MNTELSPQAAKYLRRLNEPDKSRIIKAIKRLEHEPPQGDIKSLMGKDGFRLRVGNYRVLFDVDDGVVEIHTIAPRSGAYKGGI